MQIRKYRPGDREAIVELSLRAWAPVFASLERVMSPEVYLAQHPDWRVTQRQSVEETCDSTQMNLWVAEIESAVAAFVAVKIHSQEMGEIYMLAVDPAHQRRGIGVALSKFALEWLQREGVSVAMVETGGDPGHAPARRTYEQAGFEPLAVVRYFKKL